MDLIVRGLRIMAAAACLIQANEMYLQHNNLLCAAFIVCAGLCLAFLWSKTHE